LPVDSQGVAVVQIGADAQDDGWAQRELLPALRSL
jgi:hypothetical protein